MSLQFADFDADGHTDIVTTPWQGSVHLVRGTQQGWSQPTRIQDKDGGDIMLSVHYDMEANEYRNAIDGDEAHCVSSYALDWEGDGDLDLLLGAKEGGLYLRKNEGKPDAPAFATTSELLQLEDGSDFVVQGGLTAARQVDWDGDGLQDLVCGSFGGGASWYRNVGTKTEPLFGVPVTLIEAPKGEFTDGTAGPQKNWYVTPLDYDGDGDLDLLVGGHFSPKLVAVELTEEQKAELAKLDARSEELSNELNRLHQAHMDEHDSPDGFEPPEAMMEEFQQVWERLDELRPRQGETSGIWLYRRESRG